MALIKCAECDKEISDKAVTCPHCGAPVIDEDKNMAITFVWNKKIVFSIIAIAVALFVWFYFIPHFVSKDTINSEDPSPVASTINEVLPDSENINVVKNGILPNYPQITVGEAIDRSSYLKSTEWSEFINTNNETVVAVKCIFDQDKITSEKKYASSQKNMGGKPLMPSALATNGESATIYFLVNKNKTFSYAGTEFEAIVNGIRVKSLGSRYYILGLIYEDKFTPNYGAYEIAYRELLKTKASNAIDSNENNTLNNELQQAENEYISSDSTMQQTYNKLKKSLPNDAIALLENDQNQWISERSQKVNAGSKSSKEYWNTLIQLTRERTKELNEQF